MSGHFPSFALCHITNAAGDCLSQKRSHQQERLPGHSVVSGRSMRQDMAILPLWKAVFFFFTFTKHAHSLTVHFPTVFSHGLTLIFSRNLTRIVTIMARVFHWWMNSHTLSPCFHIANIKCWYGTGAVLAQYSVQNLNYSNADPPVTKTRRNI